MRIRALFGQIRVVLVGLMYIDHGNNLAGGPEVEDFAGLLPQNNTLRPMDQELSMGRGVSRIRRLVNAAVFDRHRGGSHLPTPATPPCERVRTRRFERLR